MKYLFTSLLLVVVSCVSAQTKKVAKTTPIEKTGCVMLKGEIAFQDLLNAPSYYWMKEGADHYIPDEAAIKDMERTMWRYRIMVFMATWDTGSQNLIPKLYNVIQEADMPLNVTLYAADRSKTTGTGLENKLTIGSVPTIIVFNGDEEIGRITDRAKVSVEYDLADIALKYQERQHVNDISKTAATPYFSAASKKEERQWWSLVK